MGRVYKALTKSWQDNPPSKTTRPADFPERKTPPTATRNDEPVGFRPHIKREARSQPIVTARERVVEFYNPATAPTLNVENALISFRDLALGEDYPGRQTSAIELPAAVPPFAEPRQALQTAHLTIEPHLVALTNTDAAASEKYRTLAVRLQNLASGRAIPLKTLLITSAATGEGKSTIAINLAWVLAKSSQGRVLLIDADAQNPTLPEKLGIITQSGWLNVAEESVGFVEAAIRLEPNNLYLLAPGKSVGDSANVNKSGSLASSRIEKLFTEFAPHFEFIIVDTPAILDSADAQRIASLVDGTMLVTRAGYTPHTVITEALKLVPKERRLGVVLNEAENGDDNGGKRANRREGA